MTINLSLMKRIYLLLFSGLLISSLSACKGGKGVSPNPVSGLIVGKWNLVSDFSTFTSTPGDTTKYFGVSSDFFNFEPNDVFEVKEGAYV